MNRTTIMPAGLATLLSPAGLALLALPSAGALSLPAWSQEVAEIVVSTRRREENLQDIPVAVAAFDAEAIERQGIKNTADVVKFVPGVQFDQSFSAADTRVSIRGISSERGRTSAAVLVDGIDVTGENITAGGGSSLLNTRLLDLDRVEVVKGPQSALYGRNAFAGAISYITKQPSLTEIESKIYADVADYGTYDIRAAASGPVVENRFALGLNLGYYSSDGYYTNQNPDQPAANVDLNGGDSFGARLVAVFTPTDDLKITGSYSYSETDTDPRAVVKVGPANTYYLDGQKLPAGTTPNVTGFGMMDYGQWLGTVGSLDERDINLSLSERTNAPFAGSTDDTTLAYFKVEWDIGSVKLKSLTSYLDNDATLHEDAEYQNGPGTPVDFSVFPPPFTFPIVVNFSIDNDYLDRTDSSYINQELTVESTSWDSGFWLLGVSGFWEDTDNSDESLGWFNDPATVGAIGFCGTAPVFQFACSFAASNAAGQPAKTTERKTDSYSVFGMLSYNLSDQLRATAELRYIRDEIEVTTNTAIDRVSQYILNVPIALGFTAGSTTYPLVSLPQSDEESSDSINPRVALDYKLSDDVMVYGSVAKGTKPAGFGTAQFATPQNARIDQEKLWSYELGSKTTWLDGSLQANLALFYNKYQDRQVGVTVEDPVTGWEAAGIVNAAEAETQGVELELAWRPIEALTLALGYAYTDAEWTEFDYAEIRRNSGGIKAKDKDKAICGNALGDCDGAEVAGIPENALVLQANWTAPLVASIDWYVNAVSQYTDERALYDRDAANTAYVDSFWNVDAQLGLQTDDWLVEIYATNLFDDDTVRWAQGYQDFRDGMYGGFGGEPRDETVFGFLPPPRIVGLRASYRFGGE